MKKETPNQDPQGQQGWQSGETTTPYPCTFFADSLKNKWFRIESQVNNFQGIKACLLACQEAINNQKIDGQGIFTNYWQDLQESINFCQKVWDNMDAYQREHNPHYGDNFNTPDNPPKQQQDWQNDTAI